MPATHHSSSPPTHSTSTPPANGAKAGPPQRAAAEKPEQAAAEMTGKTEATPAKAAEAPPANEAVAEPAKAAKATPAKATKATKAARPAKAAKSAKPAKAAKTAKAKAKSAKTATPKPESAQAGLTDTTPPDITPPNAVPPGGGALIGRIPVLDVRPLVACGRRPAKAVVGEAFEISATVFREGHDAVAANVVLRDPEGQAGPWTPMRELAPGTDRWGATVSVPKAGRWTYTVEAWGDPITTWRHHAQIKIPAGMDTELVLEEGALLYERAAAGVPESRGRRDTILAAADALRDTARPAAARLAAALTPDVDHVLARHPLRDFVSSSEQLPLLVERERALYGSWYEFFPRSEGAVVETGR
ncbi:maltotransferase domain-containing protein, partial [Streptomyces sp. NPDC006365]|uniref:maltotransferase domain-containing protein n=1 Tax=Streptomyces sp. NPDC006365 TaxID=3364744 RepID=UPI003698C58B